MNAGESKSQDQAKNPYKNLEWVQKVKKVGLDHNTTDRRFCGESDGTLIDKRLNQNPSAIVLIVNNDSVSPSNWRRCKSWQCFYYVCIGSLFQGMIVAINTILAYLTLAVNVLTHYCTMTYFSLSKHYNTKQHLRRVMASGHCYRH